MEALHMSGALAHTFASGLKPLVRKDGTLDLVDTRKHDVMEHDRSPTRLDFRQGDNWTMQPAMLDAMLADGGGGPMTIRSMAKTYRRREREHVACGGPPMSRKLWFTNLLMTVSFINVEGTGHPSPDNVRQFWMEERFQDYILRNPTRGRCMACSGEPCFCCGILFLVEPMELGRLVCVMMKTSAQYCRTRYESNSCQHLVPSAFNRIWRAELQMDAHETGYPSSRRRPIFFIACCIWVLSGRALSWNARAGRTSTNRVAFSLGNDGQCTRKPEACTLLHPQSPGRKR
jgi:hypothetical protein